MLLEILQMVCHEIITTNTHHDKKPACKWKREKTNRQNKKKGKRWSSTYLPIFTLLLNLNKPQDFLSKWAAYDFVRFFARASLKVRDIK